MDTEASDLLCELLKDLVDCLDFQETHTDSTPQEFAARLQADSLLKKYNPGSPAQADAAALKKFLAVNTSCGEWVYEPKWLWQDEAIRLVKKELADFWSEVEPLITPARVISWGRFGPGSSVDAACTSLYGKAYCGSLSASSDTLQYLWHQSIWQLGDLPGWLSLNEYGTHLVRGSNLSFVPKKVEISRVICTEPALNMHFQLGFGSIIETYLRRIHGLCIKKQADVNRILVLRGDESLGTIDLASASDTISMRLLKFLLPEGFYGYLCMGRSESVRLPGGKWVGLNMVSTMGNGYTFPLQTLLFSSVIRAVYRMKGLTAKKCVFTIDGEPHIAPSSYGCFGDDMIVKRDAYDAVIQILQLMGFTVNIDKSFREGYFRESCGVDVYKGQDVRPVHIERLKGPQDWCVAYNKLMRWSDKMDIPIPRALAYILSQGPRFKQHRVPWWESDDAGYRVKASAFTEVPVRYRKFQVIPAHYIVEQSDSPEGAGKLVSSEGELPLHEHALMHACLRNRCGIDEIPYRDDNEIYVVHWSATRNWDYALGGSIKKMLEKAGLLR